MLRVGVPVWYGDGRLDDMIEAAWAHGFSYVEVSLDYPWPESLDALIVERAIRLCKDYGLEVGIHAPWRDLGLANPRDEVRRASIKVIRRCIDFAARLGAVYFNFHLMTNEQIAYPEVFQATLEAARRSLKEIARLCREKGVQPVLENNPTAFLGGVKQFREVLGGDDSIFICLDIGHAFVASAQLARRRALSDTSDLEAWLENFGDRILVVHLHDYRRHRGRVQDHLILGKGELRPEEIALVLSKSRVRYLLLEMFWRERGKRASLEDLKEAFKLLRERVSLLDTVRPLSDSQRQGP